MNRKIFFDKPSTIDIDNLPVGSIFLIDDEPHMKITKIMDKDIDQPLNCVSLVNGKVYYYDNEDLNEFTFEYFQDHQNIKIVGD